MAKEIEIKYLVDTELWNQSGYVTNDQDFLNGNLITQGYLFRDFEKETRVRTYGKKGFIAVKYFGTDIIRDEFEYEIPFNDALKMLSKMQHKVQKVRYKIPLSDSGLILEVDEYFGENQGLVTAEIEFSNLEDIDKIPTLPRFIKGKLTGYGYSNHNLAINPYSKWTKEDKIYVSS